MNTTYEQPKWTRLAGSIGWAFARGLIVNAPLAIAAVVVATMPANEFAQYINWKVDLWPIAGVLDWASANVWVTQWIIAGSLVLLTLALDLFLLSQPIHGETHDYACRVRLVNALARAYAREDFRGSTSRREWAAAVLWNAQMDNANGAWFLGLVGLPAIALASLGPWWVAGTWLGWDPWAIWTALTIKFVFVLIVAADLAHLAWTRFGADAHTDAAQ